MLHTGYGNPGRSHHHLWGMFGEALKLGAMRYHRGGLDEVCQYVRIIIVPGYAQHTMMSRGEGCSTEGERERGGERVMRGVN